MCDLLLHVSGSYRRLRVPSCFFFLTPGGRVDSSQTKQTPLKAAAFSPRLKVLKQVLLKASLRFTADPPLTSCSICSSACPTMNEKGESVFMSALDSWICLVHLHIPRVGIHTSGLWCRSCRSLLDVGLNSLRTVCVTNKTWILTTLKTCGLQKKTPFLSIIMLTCNSSIPATDTSSSDSSWDQRGEEKNVQVPPFFYFIHIQSTDSNELISLLLFNSDTGLYSWTSTLCGLFVLLHLISCFIET